VLGGGGVNSCQSSFHRHKVGGDVPETINRLRTSRSSRPEGLMQLSNVFSFAGGFRGSMVFQSTPSGSLAFRYAGTKKNQKRGESIMKSKAIPENVKSEVKEIVDCFNRETFSRDDCYYEARFKGRHLYLDRSDYGRIGPICRLTYTGKINAWEFAIFKWSTEKYNANEWFFPGAESVDGTVQGAMVAGLEAYPA